MCTATTSRRTSCLSNYWACNFFTCHLVPLIDGFIVFAVFFIETVQTVISGVDMYYRFASGFGSLEHLIDPYLSPFVGPIIGAILSLTVQYFFVYRVWVLSNRKSFWLCLLICAVSRSQSSNFGPHVELISSIVLYCRCYSSIHRGYLCEHH